ncbi:MAG TPA: ankyrin repeat domain-containing protein [Pyrinomonadaceae bacterium]|nr:ankyrin repeat domain-containing protein [Pyrinomonadaceae bacterium]
MKTILLVLCLCLSGATCAAQEKTQGAADEQLIACVESGDAECVAKTLTAGADVNGGGTPLCRAALFGREGVVKVLLAAGAKIDAQCDGDHGGTPLMNSLLAAMLVDTPNELKEGGASDENESDAEDEKLRRALSTPRESFLAIARLLVERGADVNVVANCDVGETALMYAALSANVEMVEMLLARGAKVNNEVPVLAQLREFEYENEKAKWLALPALSKEQSAMLAWFERTKAEREKIRQLLKAAGAKDAEEDGREDNERDEDNLEEVADEAFTSTIKKGDVEDLERLVKAYAGHPLGQSVLAGALRTAVIYDRAEMVKLLLARGADPNLGRLKPLMDAVSDGEVEYVRLLLEAGADVNATDEEGRSALDYAESWAGSSEGHDEVIELLKARGAKNAKQK